MADITQNLLLSAGSAADLTVYTTDSINPPANKLILAFIMPTDLGFSSSILINTVTGAGLTWVKIDELGFDTISLERRAITVFRALGPSPSAGALTITCDGPASQCQWIIVEFDNMDTGGANGADAIVQSVNKRADSGTSIIGDLAAFGNSANATVGCFGSGSVSTVMTEGSGFTKVSDNEISTVSIMFEFRNDNDTGVDMSQSVDGDMAVIGLEIKNATPFVPPPPPPIGSPSYISGNLIT